MIDYNNFKLDVNNLRQLAPLLLSELNGEIDSSEVKVITYDLGGKEREQIITVAQAKAGLNNPKMTDLVIASTKMKFVWPNLANELLGGSKW